MIIAIATPMPYAAESRLDEPKAITIAMVQIINPQFTCGT